MKKPSSRIIVLLSAILALGPGYVGFVLWRSGGGIPEWGGTREVADITAPVEVVRDENGIPHVRDLEASLFMAYRGASGHFASPFYDNLVERWVDGERFTLPSEGITPPPTLTLQPGPGGG